MSEREFRDWALFRGAVEIAWVRGGKRPRFFRRRMRPNVRYLGDGWPKGGVRQRSCGRPFLLWRCGGRRLAFAGIILAIENDGRTAF